MSSDRTPSGGSEPTPTMLDKSAVKDALTEVLGELPALKDLLLNKTPAQKSATGEGGNDTWIERDGDKEHEEHARKHYQPATLGNGQWSRAVNSRAQCMDSRAK